MMPLVSKDVVIDIYEDNGIDFARHEIYANKCNVVLSGLVATSSADTGFYTISDVAAGYMDVTAYMRSDEADGLSNLYNRQFHPHLSALRPINSNLEITIEQILKEDTPPNNLAENYAMNVGVNLFGNSKPSIMSAADITASSSLVKFEEELPFGTGTFRPLLKIKGRMRISYPIFNRDAQNVEFCTATFRISFQDVLIKEYNNSGYITQEASAYESIITK